MLGVECKDGTYLRVKDAVKKTLREKEFWGYNLGMIKTKWLQGQENIYEYTVCWKKE